MKKLITLLLAGFLSYALASEITVKVGSENAYKPFTYVDENGVSTGFDNDLVRLLAKIDGGIKLEFVPVPWNSIFVGLDSKKFDLIANQIAKNPTREEKYLFAKEPYSYGKSVLIVKDGSSINSAADLKGKTVGTSVGSNHSANIEKFAKAHPELNIKLKYYKGYLSILQDLANGRVDAMVNDPLVAIDLAKKQNVNIKITDEVFEKTPSFLLFRKGDEELANRLDAALIKAKESGELSALSIKYFGIDLTK
ncbi:transporter substrate-binding domain-containing protein [Campylobacter sp. 19-13652]|uniref:transporter substrate-binding domain-containing protein n=1 Tax=Campylobacter sp. 19-13652 TaxID=2840180 RepID=UPI001C766A13|nr:transporter substrate-binding domain-containing protein [Campylobacter sp. 19-13652]BCX78735.1 cystine ABC transporter substrate-binding protein [Campylobacter sp. 19-13652]